DTTARPAVSMKVLLSPGAVMARGEVKPLRRGGSMHPRRLFATLIPTGGAGLLCLCLTGGCTDETKTTGTQVKLTENDGADIDAMRAAMKGRPDAQKQEEKEHAKELRK